MAADATIGATINNTISCKVVVARTRAYSPPADSCSRLHPNYAIDCMLADAPGKSNEFLGQVATPRLILKIASRTAARPLRMAGGPVASGRGVFAQTN